MKANEFIKIFGVSEAKWIVNYRDKHASRTHVYKFNKSCVDKVKLGGGAYLYTKSYGEWSVSVDDLKRLVESHELVEKVGGLDKAKMLLRMRIAAELYESADEIEKAIADVESCL